MPYLPRWVKNPPDNVRNAGDVGLIPGLVKSPGLRNDHPLQYSGKFQGKRSLAVVHGDLHNGATERARTC